MIDELRISMDEIFQDIVDTLAGTPERADRRENNMYHKATGKGKLVDPVGGVEIDAAGKAVSQKPKLPPEVLNNVLEMGRDELEEE